MHIDIKEPDIKQSLSQISCVTLPTAGMSHFIRVLFNLTMSPIVKRVEPKVNNKTQGMSLLNLKNPG
jgi:hypothetical protein